MAMRKTRPARDDVPVTIRLTDAMIEALQAIHEEADEDGWTYHWPSALDDEAIQTCLVEGLLELHPINTVHAYRVTEAGSKDLRQFGRR